MKFIKLILLFLISASSLWGEDKIWLFSYNKPDNDSGGLCFAKSSDLKSWEFVGGKHRAFFHSNLGPWGNKKMKDTFLYRDSDGVWRCIWGISWDVPSFGHNTSLSQSNLVDWRRQRQEEIGKDIRVSAPLVYAGRGKESILEFKGADGKFYRTSTRDFKKFSEFKEISESEYSKNFEKLNKKITIDGEELVGQIHEANPQIMEMFEKWGQWNRTAPWWRGGERARDDLKRFEKVSELSASIKADLSAKKKISDKLFGIFFEDINYAADGGLYAELIQNRDFEYAHRDVWDWNPMTAWQVKGAESQISEEEPIHKNNPHYLSLKVGGKGACVSNFGYGKFADGKFSPGIVLKKGESYDFSAYVRGDIAKSAVRIVDESGKVVAEGKIDTSSKAWKKSGATLKALSDTESGRLEIRPLSAGNLDLDMVSLFPQKTFKNRKNGMRADLAEAIAALKPKFVRFPGGCLVHGNSIENMYRWETTIGKLEERVGLPNLWGYHQSMGLGFHEYFQFCEDIGALALPVLHSGVTCPNPQRAIPMDEMPQYVQSILNLIEYANGDAKSTVWGKKRAENGHPEPFNLKYLGIGNEDDITDMFEERFAMILKAVKEKYPEIVVVGTVGPSFAGRDYEEGWMLADKYKVEIVDEHYYVSPGWMIYNQNYYDRYERSKTKVYLGEYAAHVENGRNTVESALACAIYMANLERNGDVVEMSSYAPLLGKLDHLRWKPDMIYFDNSGVFTTTDYDIQRAYGNNGGDIYVPSSLTLSEESEELKSRLAVSVVLDSATKDTIVKIVNMTPFAIKTDLDLPFLKGGARAEKTVLSGDYDAEKFERKSSKGKLSEMRKMELEPYSFTLIRVESPSAKN